MNNKDIRNNLMVNKIESYIYIYIYIYKKTQEENGGESEKLKTYSIPHICMNSKPPFRSVSFPQFLRETNATDLFVGLRCAKFRNSISIFRLTRCLEFLTEDPCATRTIKDWPLPIIATSVRRHSPAGYNGYFSPIVD